MALTLLAPCSSLPQAAPLFRCVPSLTRTSQDTQFQGIHAFCVPTPAISSTCHHPWHCKAVHARWPRRSETSAPSIASFSQLPRDLNCIAVCASLLVLSAFFWACFSACMDHSATAPSPLSPHDTTPSYHHCGQLPSLRPHPTVLIITYIPPPLTPFALAFALNTRHWIAFDNWRSQVWARQAPPTVPPAD